MVGIWLRERGGEIWRGGAGGGGGIGGERRGGRVLARGDEGGGGASAGHGLVGWKSVGGGCMGRRGHRRMVDLGSGVFMPRHNKCAFQTWRGVSVA